MMGKLIIHPSIQFVISKGLPFKMRYQQEIEHLMDLSKLLT